MEDRRFFGAKNDTDLRVCLYCASFGPQPFSKGVTEALQPANTNRGSVVCSTVQRVIHADHLFARSIE